MRRIEHLAHLLEEAEAEVRRLRRLLRVAHRHGAALAHGRPYEDWLAELEAVADALDITGEEER